MDLALVDFDHTVTTCDTYARFLRSLATPQQLTASKWSIGPWLAGYRLGVVSAAALRTRVTRVVFSGRDPQQVAEAGARYAAEQLPALLRPEMMQRLDWHRDRGDTVVLVSGSLDAYLQPWCDRHGLELVCNRLEAIDGRLTGRYLGGDRGGHKAADIRARYDVHAYARIHAYGDSREDRPMLALAHERWYRGRRVA
ncbi:HAD-IB family hydrolase [Pseudoxanthomonas daejeonensis]|uniref:HAD-IB family hydrolase n=1 Tax=Pseudoxanthomonas daejeonensis TaxID=266062 RepID=A0ABQ6Z9L7_9GAMM|nr:HAD-IB family hydrolase [Pseudoxanthomonas daejeonensis]KAF1695873.1 HAD-IB family hydrolase [Pseudoxanthomonas daejeonensis]